MQIKTAVFTIVAKNYLPYARVLMRSVAQVHPEWRRVVVLADQVDGYFDPETEDFEIVLSTSLPIPRSRWFHFKYSIMELNTAVKPYAFEYLFDRDDLERIVYLDPDIQIYSRMDGLVEVLDQGANLVLTPHLTGALDDDKRPGEIDILRSGAYNLGFIAVARGRESMAFLAWWQQRLYDHCVVDLPRGLFVDQRWIDLVPGMFDGVVILRDPGYNVAYWNLSHRIVTGCSGGYEVAGKPLVFFHFSGFDPQQPDQLSRHQNRFRMKALPPGTRQLLLSYQSDLLQAGYAECKSWPFSFGFFRNGTRIPDLARPIHYETPDLMSRIEDPFSEEGFRAVVEQWNSPVQRDGGYGGISRLAYRIYRTRTDVQSAMPDIFGGHYRRFLEWLLVTGSVDHGISDVFLRTVADAIAACKDHQRARSWPEVAAPDELIPGSGEGEATEAPGARLRLTRLAAAIYEARPELQHYFPDPGGRDSLRFLVWLLTYGRKEHNLSPAHLAPLKAQWRSMIAGLPWGPARLRYELVLAGMAGSVHVRSFLARWRVWQKSLLLRRRVPARIPDGPAEIPPPSERGVNLVGYFSAETGVGQSVRSARMALESADVALTVRGVADGGTKPERNTTTGAISPSFPYDTNLLCVNADQTQVVRESLGESFYRGRRNIGFWVWELDEFPEQWSSAFAPYQEIWTPSTFCRDAIARRSPIPVFCVPYAASPEAPAGMDRSYFGLAPDRFIFLTAFDVLSVVQRKNPMAVIRAFEKAFGPDSGCELVVKVNHADAGGECMEMLRRDCSNGSVRVLDSILQREEMDALTNCADCIVSLHRSEGFGLLMAEAMYFGKPVIATNYSGNTDFTRPENSLLVDYRMVPVGQNCAPYNPLGHWADPDVDHAASHMRVIFSQQDVRDRLAAEGRRFVQQALSPDAVGAVMRKRIEEFEEVDLRPPGAPRSCPM
ncbi:MAG: glycosyltransferase [Bryobacteraceae bacterium]